MGRIIRKARPAPGGYMVEIEVENAYTDGRSRTDEVFVAADALRGKTAAEKRQAIVDALTNPIAEIAGFEATEPPEDKDILEGRMVALYEAWQRWKNTREEATTRSLPNAVLTALQARENAAWTRYAQAIDRWRTA